MLTLSDGGPLVAPPCYIHIRGFITDPIDFILKRIFLQKNCTCFILTAKSNKAKVGIYYSPNTLSISIPILFQSDAKLAKYYGKHLIQMTLETLHKAK